MSHVDTLAALLCPKCKGTKRVCIDGSKVTGVAYEFTPCLTCNGTGALVAGLRRECPCLNHNKSYACTSCSRLRIANHFARIHDTECDCQGRLWVLIPEAEQMEPLILELLSCVGEAVIGKTGMGPRFKQNHTGYYLVIDGVPTAVVAWEKLPEMVAAAILKSIGVVK